MRTRHPLLPTVAAFLLGSLLRLETPLIAQADDGTLPCPAETATRPESTPMTPELPPTPPVAAPPNIRLTELFPNPVGDDTLGEFIELRNDGTSDADLTGWSLRLASGRTYALHGALAAASHNAFPYSATKLALANGGTTLTLLDPQNAIIDAITYGDAPEGKSLAFDGHEWNWTTTPTLGTTNVFTPSPSTSAPTTTAPATPTTPTPPATATPATVTTPQTPIATTPIASRIRIARFMPDPTGNDSEEWIELSNEENVAVDIAGWKIDDIEGGSAPHTFTSTIIVTQGTTKFARATTGISLNNDGDSVRLLDPNGLLVDAVDYGKAKEDIAYERIDDEWRWADEVKPKIVASEPEKMEDVVEEVDDATVTDISEALESDPGTPVVLEGIAAIPLDIAGKKTFALQDPDGARGTFVQIFGTKPFEVTAGARLTVTGMTRRRGDRTYIATAADKIIRLGRSTPLPLELSIADLRPDLDGTTIALQGTIIHRTKTRLTLTDDTLRTEISLRIPDDTPEEITLGTTISTQGVLKHGTGGYELFPLPNHDLAILSSPEPDLSPDTTALTAHPPNDDERPPETAPIPSKNPVNWAAIAAAGSTVAAVFLGRKRFGVV